MGRMLLTWMILPGLLLLGAVLPSPVVADQDCARWAARLVSAQGQVEHQVVDESHWSPVTADARLCPGDSLRTGAHSRAAIRLPNETLVRLDQLTTVVFPALTAQKSGLLLEILRGIAYFFSRTPRELEFKAPFVNAAVEGTELLVSATATESRVLVLEGIVRASNAAGELRLVTGEGAVAGPGEPPVRFPIADPGDAVKWALYYPPVLYLAADEPGDPVRVAAALTSFDRGDIAGALSELDRVPARDRTADFHASRASILLYVGRVEEARAEIAHALTLDPEHSGALALRSIISLINNDPDAAIRYAESGTRVQGPRAAASRIALSYVYQSELDLDQALEQARLATEIAPNNPLGWARLAELALADRDLAEAERAARKSIALSPRIARTQTTLGFVRLARFEADQAAVAFRRAIELDQADPLPRLGLGISRIRRGQLRDGRGQIEIATILGARSSITRSYLGKAYFDERRDERAATEYRIARELDPNDPTPWFYDAIRKQTRNRPVEALRDLDRSIELNDNRAVYRSSLLLDSDLAARSASQAHIYNDLGFQRRALVEGWNSVNADPGNWSAHRLLADTYARRPRQDIARVSELFQSLLYQPINTLPLRAQQQESSLPVIAGSGPTDTALNELHPLFTGDGVNLLVDGVAGNNNTLGDNLVLYGLKGNASGSIGQFHYETDGFRENNGQRDNIYTGFVQVAVNPRLSLQAEYRHREARHGDLSLNFDPEDFSQTFERVIDQDTGRVGARFEVTPSSALFFSVIAADREEVVTEADGAFPVRISGDAHAVQSEAQYIFRSESFNLVAGGTYNDIEDEVAVLLDLTDLLGEPCPVYSPIRCEELVDLDSTHASAYLYATIEMPRGLRWTLGLSYDDLNYRNRDFDRSKTNPKLGLQWDISDAIRLRAAYFEVLKPSLVVEQTLEPTQLAGFTQFFDDGTESEADVYGAGLDVQASPDLMFGLEAIHRDVVLPGVSPFVGVIEPLEREEDLFLGYLYWTPTDRWALSTEPEYQDTSREGVGPGPAIVRTRILPLRARYFHPQGFFGALSGTYVDQTVRGTPTGFDQEDESFWVLDLEVGYRFPRRLGILSLEVKNLLGKSFLYQDQNYLVTEPVPSRFIPDRTIAAKISLSLDALLR